MPRALQGDRPRWEPTGDWYSVDGVLASGGLTDAPADTQREWIRKCYSDPGLRKLLDRQLPELQTRGLI